MNVEASYKMWTWKYIKNLKPNTISEYAKQVTGFFKHAVRLYHPQNFSIRCLNCKNLDYLQVEKKNFLVQPNFDIFAQHILHFMREQTLKPKPVHNPTTLNEISSDGRILSFFHDFEYSCTVNNILLLKKRKINEH